MSFIANSGAIAYGTSTHAPAAAEASTASIRCALRAPSANVGRPSGASSPRIGSVSVRDEEVETVEVALRMAGGGDGVRRGLRAERARIARDDLGRAAAAEPERLGTLLLEADAGLGAGDLEVQVVLAAGRDLGDRQGAVGAGMRCGRRR